MTLLLTALSYFYKLLVAHAVADYALQTEFISTYKDPGYWSEDREKYGPWWWVMSAHSLVNAGGVTLVTGSVVLGLLEFVNHFLLDTAKCLGIISSEADQALHIASKLVWSAYAVFICP